MTTLAQDTSVPITLRDILAVCDPQGALYPGAPRMAAALSMIAIGLNAVRHELESAVDQGQQLPLEMVRVSEGLMDQGYEFLSKLNGLAHPA